MKYYIFIITLILSFFLISCAHYPPDRYNTQLGAATGAGAGALIGQAIGNNTESTLIGLAAGTIFGTLVGNAIDQDYQVAREAARYGKPVLYYDRRGHAVEAIPEGTNSPNCQKVRKRIWEDGKLIRETVEEVCGPPAPAVRYYPTIAPVVRYHPIPPPPVYYYGLWEWPFVPRFYFKFGRPYHHRPHRYHHRGWHHR